MDARTDPWIFRIVVVFLGACALGATLGSVVLAEYGHEIPGALQTLGGTSIGAISGLLAALMGPRPQPPSNPEKGG